MAWAATATGIRVYTSEVGEVTLDHLFGWACCYLFVMLSPTSYQSPLCELSRQIHIECQSKHNCIYVIYKVLVYVQTSQPTTCFGLFQLGHLQVGHKGQRNYTIMQHYH